MLLVLPSTIPATPAQIKKGSYWISPPDVTERPSLSCARLPTVNWIEIKLRAGNKRFTFTRNCPHKFVVICEASRLHQRRRLAVWHFVLSAKLAFRLGCYRAQMCKQLRLADRFLKDRRADQGRRSRRFN